MERDGFCRSMESKLNCFLPRDTNGQEKKTLRALARDSRLGSCENWHFALSSDTTTLLKILGSVYFTGDILAATDQLELLCHHSKIWCCGMAQLAIQDKGHFVKKMLSCSWC